MERNDWKEGLKPSLRSRRPFQWNAFVCKGLRLILIGWNDWNGKVERLIFSQARNLSGTASGTLISRLPM
jgi:hypothetical protein